MHNPNLLLLPQTGQNDTPNSSIVNVLFEFIIAVANIVFIVFVSISISETNKDVVFNACGRDLRNYILTRVILGCLSAFVFAFFICIGQCGAYLFKNGNGMKCFVLLLFLYHAVFIGVGAKIITDAMQSTDCTSALSQASFTHSPLLAELGYVFLVLDCLWLTATLLVCCMLCSQ
jgi:hypothetical protein